MGAPETMQYAFQPCPEDHAFQWAHGARARSLEEFRKVLNTAPADVVHHHREHFQHWLRDVLQDPDLASRVQAEGLRTRDGEALRRTLDGLLEHALRDAGKAMPSPASAGARGFAKR